MLGGHAKSGTQAAAQQRAEDGQSCGAPHLRAPLPRASYVDAGSNECADLRAQLRAIARQWA